MNNTTDPKNYFYFCLKSETYKVHINNLQETVVKQIKHQIEHEEAIVCLVDCMRYCVKQEDKQQQQTMINQVKIKNDVLKQRKRSYSLKKLDKNRVRSHLIELFHTPIDDIECGPSPPKRKCLNKTTNQQLWYAIVDILDDLKLEDAILYPKFENSDKFKRESITIRTETNNLINYKCVKQNKKPIVLRAITNVRQIKNESIVDLTETITENTNNNTDNNNDSETVINQRQSVITFTTLKTTPDLNNYNKINNNNNNDNANSNNNTNNDNNNSNNDGISSTISNNDNNSDYILIIYQYLRNYLKLRYEINNCCRLFTQILKKCKYEYNKIFVQLFNKATCEISEELIKHIISSQLQQLETIEMDEIFVKLSEFFKKNENIIIGRYKLFYHIYQLLKPHKEYIHNVILLKRIYDEIEMYLKENDNRPTNQLQQQQQQKNVLNQPRPETLLNQQLKNILNQPRPEAQALLNRPQQQQENLLNQALLNQQQQKNILNHSRHEAQALLNRPQQQENLSNQALLNQQQKNVLNQQIGVAQALNYQQRQQQQQENVLNQSRPGPHAFLSHQQQQPQQQENVLNQHRSIAPALPNQQQQPSVPATQALFNLQQQQLQQRLWQQQQRDNQQRPVAVILMNQQRQENELNQSRSIAQAVLNHQQQQQDNILHHAKSVTRNLLNQQQPRQQENTIENVSNQIKQQKQNNMRPLQKIQHYQKQQEQQHSSKNTPTNLPLTDHCISTLSNQQLKPQPQPQVKNSIIFTQIQLRILETQIKKYHKLFTGKVNLKHSSVKQNNQQQSQNNTSKQPQQNQSTPVSSSSTHQFVNNLGNIIRKVDGNSQNLNNHRLIKPVNNGQLLKQQLSNEKSNNPTILRNTLDIYSNLSKVPEQSPPQQVPSVANLSVLQQQQQRKPSTVLPALSQISSITRTTTTTTPPVLSPTNQIRDVRILPPPTTITTVTTSSILSPLITTTVTPTHSLSDSLFSSIPPPMPRITENATLPTTKTTITTSLSLPILTVTTTPTTNILISSKSTPITTTTTLSKEIKEPVLTTVSKIAESTTTTTTTTTEAIREEVDTISESVSPVQQSTETRPESDRVAESPRSLSSPTSIVSSSTAKTSITMENNDKSVKFLESFDVKDEVFRQIDSNYENETNEPSMYSKFNDSINIDDLDKYIKIEDKIGGVSPSDSGLGSPLDLDMADLLHSNNNNNNNSNNNNTLNDTEETQPIQDVSSYIIQEPNEEPFICLCGKKAQYLCACGFSMYCSEACRLIDWECHQSLCLRTIR